jgi:hypothetical protein
MTSRREPASEFDALGNNSCGTVLHSIFCLDFVSGTLRGLGGRRCAAWTFTDQTRAVLTTVLLLSYGSLQCRTFCQTKSPEAAGKTKKYTGMAGYTNIGNVAELIV